MTNSHTNGDFEDAVVRHLSTASEPLSAEAISKALGDEKPIIVQSALSNLRDKDVVEVLHDKGRTSYRLRKTETRQDNKDGKPIERPKPQSKSKNKNNPKLEVLSDSSDLGGDDDTDSPDWETLPTWGGENHGIEGEASGRTRGSKLDSERAIDEIIRKYRKLGKKKEQRLTAQALEGNKRARDLIVRHHYWLIRPMVRTRLANHNWAEPFPLAEGDLINICALAVYLMIPAFDPLREVRLSTFFHMVIDRAISQCLSRTNIIRVPRRQQRINAQILAAHDDLLFTLGRTPTDEEIAKAARVSSRAVENWRIAPVKSNVGSLDELLENHPDFQPETTPVEQRLNSRAIDTLDELLSELPDREQDILRKRFGLNSNEMTLAKIAAEHKLTPQRINAIEKRALQKLKKAADRRGITFSSLIDSKPMSNGL